MICFLDLGQECRGLSPYKLHLLVLIKVRTGPLGPMPGGVTVSEKVLGISAHEGNEGTQGWLLV